MPTNKPSDKPLTIGFVFDDSLDKGDGVQQYILGLGDYYRQQGHSVHYLVGQTERTDIPSVHSLSKNIRVSFNGNKLSVPLLASKKKIKALFAVHQFDVLHVQMPHSPFLAQRVMLLAPATTKIVGTFHILPNSKLVTFANRMLKLLVWRSLKRLDHTVSVSPAAQAFLQKNWHVQSEVVPNIVDLKKFRGKKPVKELAASLNIVFLGRLVERKGCKALLEAIKQIVRLNLTDIPFKVIICGKGPLLDELESFAKMNGLNHLVTFTGFVSEAEKPNYLAAADLAVFPAMGGESFGIVLIEAMAASRGVVLGGDNPGYRSVLGDKPEQLFDAANAHDAALLLKRYLENGKERQKAHDWQTEAVQQYDIPVVAAKLLALYRQ